MFWPQCVSQVEVQRRPWLYDDEDGRQVGGFVKDFDNISFLTVKVNLHLNQLTFSDPVMSSLCLWWGQGSAAAHLFLMMIFNSCRVLVTWFHQINQLLPSPCSPDSSRNNPTDLWRVTWPLTSHLLPYFHLFWFFSLTASQSAQLCPVLPGNQIIVAGNPTF